MEIISSQNSVIIELDSKIDYKINASFEMNKTLFPRAFNFIILNFSRVQIITLPGIMNLVLIINDIFQSQKETNQIVETLLGECSDKQLGMLANFGFLSSLTFHGNLKMDRELVEFNANRRKFWSNAIKSNKNQLSNVFWPISNIPKKGMTGFDQDISKFFNDFIDYFNTIIISQLFKLTEEGNEYYQKHFLKAINEIIKNIWDHSESWGIASIYSNKKSKTTLCLFDSGIGFIQSYIKRKGKYDRSFENDKKIINWLFKEGNTTQTTVNHGHGLSIIIKFIEITKGILLITTDSYMIQYSVKTGMQINKKEYFPGTQIMINF